MGTQSDWHNISGEKKEGILDILKGFKEVLKAKEQKKRRKMLLEIVLGMRKMMMIEDDQGNEYSKKEIKTMTDEELEEIAELCINKIEEELEDENT